MLVKCICTNCAGHLEFEEENAGERIPCPHCGFETALTLPGAKTEEEPKQEYLVIPKELLQKWLLRGAVVILAAGLGGWALYRWGVPWIQERYVEIESTTVAMLVLIALCVAVPFVLCWLILPVLLFFQLQQLNRSVAQLAEAVRASRASDSVSGER